ncbi:Putative auto-transporter adhesin, head GIN domain [Sphingomonas gellani]|uniref:Putative auto-transporter adhesin, head GIN domain n=1 Tax=Sphingomonas gellani TaxID=1166340 RepID=A0A1H8HAW6_9SPHN|nr:DUF2807 domain-containing protein [Sphingomonas gellani]SEN52708.1 Putative auto-transporter adhesin, head GIN domain [Sphingomonas gellani]
MRSALRSAVLLLLACAGTVHAAERSVHPGSFDRLRLRGPYEVTVASGSPGATLTGERDAIEGVEVRLDGNTLVVQPGNSGWGTSRPQRDSDQPVRIALTTPRLAMLAVVGAARVKVAAMKADRVDVAVTGSGSVTVDGIATDMANLSAIGTGTLTVAGRAARARLLGNGAATIDAAGLDTGEIYIRTDGTGDTRARARYGADIGNSGVGRVAVVGTPKCRVVPQGGPVSCGQPR